MKIGLVTFYNENFGSILQCYSTKYIIEKQGYECDILSEIVKEKEGNLIKYAIERMHFIISNTLKSPSFFFRWIKAHGKPAPLSAQTLELMNGFVSEEFEVNMYDYIQLEKISKTYNAFIVGSDQVWNANNKIPDSFFLKFAPDNKKIAFAVSFGTGQPSEKFLNKIKVGIKGFQNISVREESGIGIVESISTIPVKRMADPTVMLTKDEWMVFCSESKVNEQNYILVHFLNSPNRVAIESIKRMNGTKKILCIAYKYDIFDELNWEFLDCDPREYVSYINRADFIFTDSFHTSMFAVNLGKQFYVFEREYLHTNKQTNRIIEMLKRYGLEDRFIVDINQIEGNEICDYEYILEKERKLTIEYLVEQIKEVVGN